MRHSFCGHASSLLFTVTLTHTHEQTALCPVAHHTSSSVSLVFSHRFITLGFRRLGRRSLLALCLEESRIYAMLMRTIISAWLLSTTTQASVSSAPPFSLVRVVSQQCPSRFVFVRVSHSLHLVCSFVQASFGLLQTTPPHPLPPSLCLNRLLAIIKVISFCCVMQETLRHHTERFPIACKHHQLKASDRQQSHTH